MPSVLLAQPRVALGAGRWGRIEGPKGVEGVAGWEARRLGARGEG